MCGLAVVILSCTTVTLSPGSPITQVQVPAGTPSTGFSPSTPTARPVPVTLIADDGSSHGRVRQAPDPSSAPTTHPPPPTTTGIDYGPTEIAPIPIEYAIDWRGHVAVWFRSGDVERVLAIIFCESSGRWNAAGPVIASTGMQALGLLQHLDGYWPERAIKADAAGYHNHGDIWSPTDQMAVSAWLAYNTPQGFGHWVCDKGGEQ